LASFFAAQGLSDRVALRGFVAQNDLVALYHAADLCVVPSILYESFSYTCLQAMACARPVVATTMGGIPEVVIDGETGLLVPPGDAVGLAAALQRLIGDARLRSRLGRAGRERAVQLYAHRTVAQQNLAVYAEVIYRQHGRVKHARA
jgi:glycosyltransferase involved in cell wall biosynthesis